MKKLILSLAFVLNAIWAFAQQSEQDAVKQTVNNLFTAMRTSDTTLLRSVFDANMVLQSMGQNADGSTRLITEKASDFVKSVGTPHKAIYDERITITDIKIDGPLASVWAPYKFYLGTQFSHCGVDVFQLMKTVKSWKIVYIVDTRRKDNCIE